MLKQNRLLSKGFNELVSVFYNLKNKSDIEKLLKDLFTDGELEDFVQRVQVAKEIFTGLTYQKIADKLKVSTTTVCRVGRAIKYGAGGYKRALKKNP